MCRFQGLSLHVGMIWFVLICITDCISSHPLHRQGQTYVALDLPMVHHPRPQERWNKGCPILACPIVPAGSWFQSSFIHVVGTYMVVYCLDVLTLPPQPIYHVVEWCVTVLHLRATEMVARWMMRPLSHIYEQARCGTHGQREGVGMDNTSAVSYLSEGGRWWSGRHESCKNAKRHGREDSLTFCEQGWDGE
jgi:hypothetical protein